MSNTSKLIFIMAFSVLACSCNRHVVSSSKVGDWNSIELSKSTITFSKKGGTATVEAKNYTSWWINNICITGTDNYYYADPGNDRSFLSAKGDGISARIGDRKNTVIITVDPSSGEKRSWDVHMQAGNAFTCIHVIQKR